jgi:hypothetical protein
VLPEPRINASSFLCGGSSLFPALCPLQIIVLGRGLILLDQISNHRTTVVKLGQTVAEQIMLLVVVQKRIAGTKLVKLCCRALEQLRTVNQNTVQSSSNNGNGSTLCTLVWLASDNPLTRLRLLINGLLRDSATCKPVGPWNAQRRGEVRRSMRDLRLHRTQPIILICRRSRMRCNDLCTSVASTSPAMTKSNVNRAHSMTRGEGKTEQQQQQRKKKETHLE